MRTFKRILKWTVLTCLIVPAFVFLFLCFRTVELPQALADRIFASASGEDCTIGAKRILFRLTRGVRIENLRVAVRGESLVKAGRIDVEMDFFRLPWDWRRMVREVSVRDLDFPSLPAAGGEGGPLPEIELPEMRPFRLKLVKANVLGIKVRSCEAARVKISPSGVKIDDIRVSWPDADTPMKASGELELFAKEKRLVASVRGQARQHNIRPLLETLDVPSALEYIDAFTGIIDPIDAIYRVEANLENGSSSMIIDLHPVGGAYRGIPLKDADGRLEIAIAPQPDSPPAVKLHVGPLFARMADGSNLSGSLSLDCPDRDHVSLAFDRVQSSLSITNAVVVSEALSPDWFSFIECAAPPEISLSGTLGVTTNTLASCDLSGAAALKRAVVFGISLANATCAFNVSERDVSVERIRSETTRGGAVAGGAKVFFDGRFHTEIQASGVPLEDIAGMFKMDIGDRSGKVYTNFILDGSAGADFFKTLSGRGTIKCQHGHLAQLNIFSGFTDYLVEHVPGVANLVQQSRASLDFTIENGVFKTDNLLIEGDVFSIRAEGLYDIAADRLEFKVHVNLFRNETFLSRLATPISWTFNKLLLEFNLSGPLAEPVWRNDSIIGGLGKKKGS